MEKKRSNKLLAWIIAAVAVVVAVVAVAAGCYLGINKNSEEGKKSVTIEVVNDKGEVKSYSVKTDKETMKEIFDETEGFSYSGTDSQYGLMVDTVNGLKAVYDTDNAYWGFKLNGNYCENGISTQKVEDNDVVRVEYTKG